MYAIQIFPKLIFIKTAFISKLMKYIFLHSDKRNMRSNLVLYLRLLTSNKNNRHFSLNISNSNKKKKIILLFFFREENLIYDQC